MLMERINSQSGKKEASIWDEIFVCDASGLSMNPINGSLFKNGEKVFIVTGIVCGNWLRKRIEFRELTGLRKESEMQWNDFVQWMNEGRLVWM